MDRGGGVSTGGSQDFLMAVLCPQVSSAGVTLESHLKMAPGRAYSRSIFRREGNGTQSHSDSELGSCVKAEVAVLCSPYIKQH